MSTTPKNQSRSAYLAVGGFVVLHLLCCGVPLLAAAGVLGGLGGFSFWAGDGWWAAVAGILAVVLVVWFFRRRRVQAGSIGAECCWAEESAAHPRTGGQDAAGGTVPGTGAGARR